MLYVICATLDNFQHTQRLLAALQQVAGIPMHVVIVDNGSTDETCDQLRGQPLTLIENERNLGAGAAWNLGIRYAIANQAEAILVCGNDTAPFPGTVERLYALLREGALFVTGTQVVPDTPGEVVPPCGSDVVLLAAPDFSFFMFQPVMVEILARWDASVAYTLGAQLKPGDAAPATIMSPWELGLFDQRFVLGYAEDNDYHHRCKQAGIPLLRDPGAFFWHDCSLTIRTHPELAQLNQSTTFRRNLELFKAKWGGFPADLDVQQAKPNNVTPEQWNAMTGNRAVAELPRDEWVAASRALYASYGVGA